MKGMNISRNAFIGEINSQDIAAEREQPHNGAKNFKHLTKNCHFLTTVRPEPNLNELCEKYYCSTKVVQTVRSGAVDRSTEVCFASFLSCEFTTIAVIHIPSNQIYVQSTTPHFTVF